MKLIRLKCTNCGADLELDADRKQAFCTYCGTKQYIDDESIHITNRFIDEARLKEAEVRLKELEYAHEREIREETIRKEQKESFRMCVIVFLCILTVTFLFERLRPFFVLVIIIGLVILSSMKSKDRQSYVVGQRFYCSSKSRMISLLLCLFLGVFGVHRLYVGKFGSGILYFFTVGGFGIGWLLDLVRILFGVFRDSEGYYIKEW